MKKIVRLTETDLSLIIKRVIKENRNAPERYVIDFETGEMVGTHQYGIGFVPNELGLEMGYTEHPTSIPDGTKFEDSSMESGIMSPREYRRNPYDRYGY